MIRQTLPLHTSPICQDALDMIVPRCPGLLRRVMCCWQQLPSWTVVAPGELQLTPQRLQTRLQAWVARPRFQIAEGMIESCQGKIVLGRLIPPYLRIVLGGKQRGKLY